MVNDFEMKVTLQDELSWKEDIFFNSNYGKTAKNLRKINNSFKIYAKKPEALLHDVHKLTSIFEKEFVNFTKNKDMQQVRRYYLKIIQKILEQALIKTPDSKKMFSALSFFTYQGMCASNTITEITKVLGDVEKQSKEAEAYLSLFLFNVQIEGQFFPTLRTLYGLKLAGMGKEIDFNKIRKVSYKTLKCELVDSLLDLLELYDDFGRYLRNSIAHANFIYDKGILTCWNIDQRTKNENWRINITPDELRYKLIYFYTVSDAFVVWFLIRDTIEKLKKFFNI